MKRKSKKSSDGCKVRIVPDSLDSSKDVALSMNGFVNPSNTESVSSCTSDRRIYLQDVNASCKNEEQATDCDVNKQEKSSSIKMLWNKKHMEEDELSHRKFAFNEVFFPDAAASCQHLTNYSSQFFPKGGISKSWNSLKKPSCLDVGSKSQVSPVVSHEDKSESGHFGWQGSRPKKNPIFIKSNEVIPREELKRPDREVEPCLVGQNHNAGAAASGKFMSESCSFHGTSLFENSDNYAQRKRKRKKSHLTKIKQDSSIGQNQETSHDLIANDHENTGCKTVSDNQLHKLNDTSDVRKWKNTFQLVSDNHEQDSSIIEPKINSLIFGDWSRTGKVAESQRWSKETPFQFSTSEKLYDFSDLACSYSDNKSADKSSLPAPLPSNTVSSEGESACLANSELTTDDSDVTKKKKVPTATLR